jgi:hypothetical protein
MAESISERLGRLARSAASQAGHFSIEQAAPHGLDRRALRAAICSGLLDQVHSGVYRFAGAPITEQGDTWAAVLQVDGSFASHEAALRLHGIDRVPAEVAVSIVRGGNHRHEGIRVHRFDDVCAEHLTTVDGIPTTSIERAVVDVTSVFTSGRLEHLVDELTIRRRMTTVGAIGRALRQVNRRGRLHIARLPLLLDARLPSEPTPRSILERRTRALIAASGLPTPSYEYPLPCDHGRTGFVDCAWTHAMLILEIDGRRWHARERDMARDRARDRAAARAGWQTLRVLDEEVACCPEAVISEVADTYHRRLQQLRLAS